MRVNKKRRRQGKTNYSKRLKTLTGNIPRIVVRKSNRYLTAQDIESKESQDKIIIGVNSKDLLEYDWPKEQAGSLKSVPAAYLTGVLLGKKMKDLGKENGILDIGLERTKKKGRIYSVLKGVLDSGIKINHKKEILPDEKRISGEHLKNKIDIKEIKKKILGEK